MPDEKQGSVGVVLVDDHRMFAESLARLLGFEEDIEVLGIGANGREAVTLVEQFRPRVLLIDYDIPEGNGVQVATEIKQRWPETMIVMITGSADDRVLLSAIEAGCLGYVTKDRASSEVVNAVRVAAAGEALISPAQMARLLPRLTRSYRAVGSDLTERELEVLRLLARGSTNKAIASELFLSVNTIRNYVQAILTKLDAHSKLEAVATAVREGIIDYDALS
jgi:DNA-binding NarL/FixJ family response regulator